MRILKPSAAVVMFAGVLAYLAAVMQRSSTGAASLEASERFSTTAEQLASLAVWQIAVYAIMQIPVGILLDRFGPRKLLVFGAVVMGIGQVLVAIATSLGFAVFGRVLVGLGDAFTFVSMIRLINGLYSGRRASLLQQWLGNVGQLGQVASAIPFAALLGLTDWTIAFLALGAVSGAVAVTVALTVRDDRVVSEQHYSKRDVRASIAQLSESIKNPAVRLAFWTHFSSQSVGTVFVLLWGLPFLVNAESLDKAFAHLLLSSFVLIGIAAGVVYGWVCSSKPAWRTPVVTLMASLVCVAWAVVIAQPSTAPTWMLVALVVVMAAAGPASMIAFDYSREFVKRGELGTANGFVNIGGFLATFVMMFLIGVLLDFHFAIAEPDTVQLYGLEGFRFALPVQILVIAIGIAFNLREWRLVQRLKPL